MSNGQNSPINIKQLTSGETPLERTLVVTRYQRQIVLTKRFHLEIPHVRQIVCNPGHGRDEASRAPMIRNSGFVTCHILVVWAPIFPTLHYHHSSSLLHSR
jgi:hypothetical protein